MKTRLQLEAEAHTRRSRLEQYKNELARASDHYKRTRNDHDGARVTDFANRARLAELALDGVLEELAALDRPRPVSITSPRDELVRMEQQITQRREYRHREHERSVERERRACGYTVEAHIQTHLANLFRSGERMRRQADEQDQRQLDSIRAQLNVLDARDVDGNAAA